MNTLKLFAVITLIITLLSCNAQTADKEAVASGDSSGNIETYYFHFTARCVTCKTIEADAKKNLETLFPEKFRQGLITFRSVNLDEPASKSLAKNLGVTGQALLLVKGNKKINLTNEAFMYAMVKPEKFREIINEKIVFLMAE